MTLLVVIAVGAVVLSFSLMGLQASGTKSTVVDLKADQPAMALAAPAGASPAAAPAVPLNAPAAAAPLAAPAAAAEAPAPPAAEEVSGECLTPSAFQAFWTHFKAGHLESSPEQQVKDIVNFDAYVKTHTVLVENMLAPLLDGSVNAFWEHFKAGHLEASPFQQLQDILSLDQYTKTHTVLVENMLEPLVGSC